jgi:hypothetical protein
VCVFVNLTWSCRCGPTSAAKISCVVVAIILPYLQTRDRAWYKDLLNCLRVCVCVCVCISNMDLPLWAGKCSENLVRGSCNHFGVTAEKMSFVVHGLAGLSLCVCVCVCVYI